MHNSKKIPSIYYTNINKIPASLNEIHPEVNRVWKKWKMPDNVERNVRNVDLMVWNCHMTFLIMSKSCKKHFHLYKEKMKFSIWCIDNEWIWIAYWQHIDKEKVGLLDCLYARGIVENALSNIKFPQQDIRQRTYMTREDQPTHKYKRKGEKTL